MEVLLSKVFEAAFTIPGVKWTKEETGSFLVLILAIVLVDFVTHTPWCCWCTYGNAYLGQTFPLSVHIQPTFDNHSRCSFMVCLFDLYSRFSTFSIYVVPKFTSSPVQIISFIQVALLNHHGPWPNGKWFLSHFCCARCVYTLILGTLEAEVPAGQYLHFCAVNISKVQHETELFDDHLVFC